MSALLDQFSAVTVSPAVQPSSKPTPNMSLADSAAVTVINSTVEHDSSARLPLRRVRSMPALGIRSKGQKNITKDSLTKDKISKDKFERVVYGDKVSYCKHCKYSHPRESWHCVLYIQAMNEEIQWHKRLATRRNLQHTNAGSELLPKMTGGPEYYKYITRQVAIEGDNAGLTWSVQASPASSPRCSTPTDEADGGLTSFHDVQMDVDLPIFRSLQQDVFPLRQANLDLIKASSNLSTNQDTDEMEE